MPTADADDCKDAIDSAFGGLQQHILDNLPPRAGYLYQAFVFASVGSCLHNDRHAWEWRHPPGGEPTFANSNGFSFGQAKNTLSHMERTSDGRLLLQELTVAGVSGVSHDLDLCLAHSYPPLAGNFPCYRTGSLLECKNHDRSLPLGTARELVGLLQETGNLHYPLGDRIALISANDVDPSARHLLDAYGIYHHRNALPPTAGVALPNSPAWVEHVADLFC